MRKVITKPVYVYHCDFCNKKLDRRRTCAICAKDVCDQHLSTDPRDGDSDYPMTYCKKCFEIGQPYLEQLIDIQRRLDSNEEELEKKWQKKCLEQTDPSP